MKTHNLKTVPPYFQSAWEDDKLFEVRKDDRGFEVGDLLVLEEYQPKPHLIGGGEYTGRTIQAVVTSKLRGGNFGIHEDHCVLSIHVISKHEQPESQNKE